MDGGGSSSPHAGPITIKEVVPVPYGVPVPYPVPNPWHIPTPWSPFYDGNSSWIGNTFGSSCNEGYSGSGTYGSSVQCSTSSDGAAASVFTVQELGTEFGETLSSETVSVAFTRATGTP